MRATNPNPNIECGQLQGNVDAAPAGGTPISPQQYFGTWVNTQQWAQPVTDGGHGVSSKWQLECGPRSYKHVLFWEK